MHTDRDTTRIVRSWLEEGRTALPDHVLDAVLDQVPATPQRRAWWPAWRLADTNTYAKLAIGVAAVAVVAIVGISFFPRAGEVGAPASPPVLPIPTGESLSAGPYALSSFPVGISFEVPEGWFSCSLSTVEQGVCLAPSDVAPVTAVGFLIVDNVVVDPCDSSEALRDPSVGPSVDDLVNAISSLEGFDATAPRDITIDGFDGKEFTVTAPATAGCALKTWATTDRTNGVGPGEVNLLRILDVNGTRIVISGAYHPWDPASAESFSALRQVMDSVRIEP